jgi:starvation-inducible DNA-binding protein
MVDLLNQHLADAVDLVYQAKQAHWNVKGPSFIALHQLFDVLLEEIEEHVDNLAERAVALGGTACGTVRVAAGRSRLAEYPLTWRQPRMERKHQVRKLPTWSFRPLGAVSLLTCNSRTLT